MSRQIFLLIVFFCSQAIFAQSNITDSLKNELENAEPEEKVNILIRLAGNFNNNDPHASEKYYKRAMKLASETGYDYGYAKALANYSIILKRESKYYASIDTLNRAKKIFKKLGKYPEEAYTIGQIANTYYYLGQYDKSADKFIEAFKIFDNAGIPPDDTTDMIYNVLSIIYTDYGLLQYRERNLERAEEYFTKAYNIGKKNSDKRRIAGSLVNLGMVHKDRGKNKEALDYYRKALTLNKEINHKHYLTSNYMNIANIYRDEGEYSKALKNYEMANKLNKELHHKEGMIFVYMNLSKMYNKKNEPDKALTYADSAETISSSTEMWHFLSDIYKLKSEIYAKKNDYAKALKNYISYHEISDSLYSAERQDYINKLLIENETNKTKAENKLLKEQKKWQERITYILMSFLIIALGLMAWIFYQNRQKQKMNRLLQEKNTELENMNRKLSLSESNLRSLNSTKDKFFSIIAHDLKNPLASFYTTSEYLAEELDDMNKEEISELVDTMNQSSSQLKNLLENLLLWAHSQTGRLEFMPENVDISMMADNNIALQHLPAEQKNITIKNNIPRGTKAYVDLNMLNTILRNLVSNAIKFTNPGGKIEISSKDAGDKVILSVSDDGVGISKSNIPRLFSKEEFYSEQGTAYETGTGLGLILVREFVDMHDGEISVESSPGAGTTFNIKLPIENNSYAK